MTPQLPTLSPPEFIARWRDAGFGERQGAQSFFNDLCGLAGHPKIDAIAAGEEAAQRREQNGEQDT